MSILQFGCLKCISLCEMSDIVISGISGSFPQSDNVEEFKKNLLNKVYLVGDPENRIKFKFHNISGNFGLMKNLDKFDYEAFFIPLFAASKTDPQGYIVLERVFEALIDAGVSPSSLKGTKTGVYAGCFNFDALEHWMAYKDSSSGHASIGCSAYSLSNRISFYLGCHGPSFTGKNFIVKFHVAKFIIFSTLKSTLHAQAQDML